MPGYPKIWTFIRHERWFKKLKASQRGAFLEMLLMTKEQQDNGHVVVNSVSTLASELSINRKVMSQLLSEMTTVDPPILVIIDQQPLDLYFPKYMKWQKMSMVEAIKHIQDGGQKRPTKKRQAEQSTSKVKAEHSPAVKKPPGKTNPDHKQVIEYFCQAYQKKIGAPYAFHGKEDAGKIKTLLSRWTLDQSKHLIDTMFASTDEFYRKGGGCTIGVLLANDNKLVQELRRKVDGTEDLNEAGAKTAANMVKVLKEMECQKPLLE